MSDGIVLTIGADISTLTSPLQAQLVSGYFAESFTDVSPRWYGVRVGSGTYTPPSNISYTEFSRVTQGSTELGYIRPEVNYSPLPDRSQDFDPTKNLHYTKNIAYTRAGGATDGANAFSYALPVVRAPRCYLDLEWFNTKIDESFVVTFDYEWSSTGTGLTAMRTEDIWVEAAYYNHATRESMDYVLSYDKYDMRGLIFDGSIGTPTAAATSSATWSGALGSAVKQKISIVVSPKKVGLIKFFIVAGRCPWTQNLCSLSATTEHLVYFDPLPTLSAAP